MAKVNIYMNDFFRYDIETSVFMYDEKYIYEIPDSLLEEYEENKKKSKEIQEKLHNIYREKQGY